jgi:hypothetical protein
VNILVLQTGGAPKKTRTASWSANTPEGTDVEVWVRASDDRLALSTEQFVQAESGVEVEGVRGRFLEVRTALTRSACDQDPYLESLEICSYTKTLTLLAPPTDQQADEETDAAFQVVALGTEPLTYQWFLNGAEVGPNSPILELTSVDCLDVGQYSVHITDAAGDQVDAGPALLNVVPHRITIPLTGIASVYPAQITVHGPETVSSVEVVINLFKHERPDDVDMLLVSPRGEKIMLMSDAGGITGVPPPMPPPVQYLTIHFTQSALAIPDDDELFSWSYSPANYGAPVENSFPAATGNKPQPPAGPYTDTLSSLNGMDPRGNWRLYIVDDTGERSGFIVGSWCLILNP